MSSLYFQNRKLYTLDINTLNPNQDQPRKYIDQDSLEELAHSILKLGVLEPIIFTVDEDNKNIIVAGERRFEAAKIAGLNTVPAIYIDGNVDEIALVENILRQDLTAIEEAEGIQKIKDKCSYTDDTLSEMLGKSRSNITQILSLNTLPDKIKNDCRNDVHFPKSKLIEIAREKDPKTMALLYNKAKKYNMSLEDIKKTRKDGSESTSNKSIKPIIKSFLKAVSANDIIINDNEKEEIKADIYKIIEALNQLITRN